MTFSTPQKLAAEALGTALLLAIVVGSGVMGEALAGGNDAIALLGNTLATGAGLVVLILIFGPVSGAHFNPAVTLAFLLRREIGPARAGAYVAVQLAGGVLGVFLAHAMFDLDIVQQSLKSRAGLGQALGEAVATFGLVLTILGCARLRPDAVPYAVGLFITAGYWFTSSTSFANPAVSLARTLTNTFAGVAPRDAPVFIAAECAGALLATYLAGWLFEARGAGYRRADEGAAPKISGAR
ncbi:MAG: MIP/aquaporin family protein [Amphiplicatus sp.]